MFGRRRNAGDGDLASQQADLAVEASEIAGGEPSAIPGGVTGPWDVAEPHPELPRVDLGSLQVPVLEGTDIQLVFAEQHGAWVTVRYQLSELQLQAFAAPKRAGIWDEVRGEIVNEIAGAGAAFLHLRKQDWGNCGHISRLGAGDAGHQVHGADQHIMQAAADMAQQARQKRHHGSRHAGPYGRPNLPGCRRGSLAPARPRPAIRRCPNRNAPRPSVRGARRAPF